jgi:hypothetical protein
MQRCARDAFEPGSIAVQGRGYEIACVNGLLAVKADGALA